MAKKKTRIGVCSDQFRPQKYESRDPHPYLPFEKRPVKICWPLVVLTIVAVGFFVSRWA